MRVAFGTDHAGFSLRETVLAALERLGCEVIDHGIAELEPVDFPDFARLVGESIQRGEADRGVLLCGSGVGVCIAANKMHGVRASVTHDTYSAHQGVEHDGMNVMCLGGRIVGVALADELVTSFIRAEFQHEERFQRRVDKINQLESERMDSAP